MRKVVLALVAALSALLAAPALAADGTLSSASPTYTWEGGPMNGVGQNGSPVGFGLVRCTPVYQCDNEHLEVKEAGTLTIEIKAGEGSNDLDVRLYKSDADGTPPPLQGDPTATPAQPVAEDIRTEKDAKIVVRNLKPGFYIAQVAFFNATQGVYTGTATFTPPPPPPAPVTAAPKPPTSVPTQSSPSAAKLKAAEAKRKKKLAACKKKAKKIKSSKKRKAAQKKCTKKYGKKKKKRKKNA